MNIKKLKILHKLASNKTIAAFLAIVIFGLILRVYFIFNFGVFTDEVFYTEAARLNSFGNILSHNFWIKDHGVLYIAFLKIIQFVTTDIIFLRLSNVFIYLLISFSLFSFFKKIRNDLTSLIPVALFSFFPYFVFTNVYVSVYNFVILFSVLTFICVSRFILFKEKNSWVYLFSFVIFLTLAFYSDYSSIYLYLSLIGVLIFTYFFKKEKFVFITPGLFLNFILILPGAWQFLTNLYKINNLSSPCCFGDSKFSLFFPNFLHAVFFRTDFIFSSFFLIVLVISLFLIFLKNKNEAIKYLITYTGFGFLTSFVFLYFVNRFFLPIFVERTFFIFNFFLILCLYCLFFFKFKFKKIFFLVIFLFGFVVFGLFQTSANLDIPGNVPDVNIRHTDLIRELIKKENIKDVEEVIFLDKNYFYYPLQKYYFLGVSDYMKKTVIEDFGNKRYLVTKTFRSLKYHSRSNYNQLFILFDTKDFDFNGLKKEIANYKKETGSNSEKIFYALECSSKINYCSFKKLDLK